MYYYGQPDGYIEHYGVLGMKWGQHRAKVNSAKSIKAMKKGNQEKALKYANKSAKIKKKHTLRTDAQTYQLIEKKRTGKLFVQSMMMGTYGALKYNQARAKGSGRARSFVAGTLGRFANESTAGIWAIAKPRVDASIKKQELKRQKGL